MTKCSKCGSAHAEGWHKNLWKTHDGEQCCASCSRICIDCGKLFFEKDIKLTNGYCYCIGCFKKKYNQ